MSTVATARPGEVKICGVRDATAARACAAAGADWAGLNRVVGVRRFIADSAVAPVVAALGAVRPILVVRDLSLAEIEAEVQRTGVAAVQLHGSEAPELGAALAARGVFVVKALHSGHLDDIARVRAWASCARRFVLDGREAGSGQTWAWRALDLQGGRLAGVPVWLAGGLHPGNVASAIEAVGPAGVDVASGVEDPASRRQAPAAIAAFVAAARAAYAGQANTARKFGL